MNLIPGEAQRKRSSSMGIPVPSRIEEASQLPMIVGSPAPFRKELEADDKASVAVLTGAYCDPEIAEYLEELDETMSSHTDGMGSGSFSSLFSPLSADITQDKVPSDFASEEDTWTEYGSITNSKLPRPIARTKSDITRPLYDSMNFHRNRSTLVHTLTGYGRSPKTGRRSLKLFRGMKSRKPMVSSNPLGVDAPAHVELSKACLEHMRYLLKQVLIHEHIDPALGWEEVLLSLLLKVSDNVNLDMKSSNDMDIRHCVKIKKLPGSLPQHSLYVTGFVCTKNVAHKKMQRVMLKPRILILTFSLEYQRVENQFVSLDTVIAQEEEHLQHLVQRIIALSPTLVLVEKTVSRIALDFLLNAGISVALNVKPTVIEAVSRYCKGDMVSSVDKLSLSPVLGECEKFSAQTFAHRLIPGNKKTILFFEGCAKDIGCSIVLRGDNLDTLSKVKYILKFMLLVVHNLKLETSLLRDHFAKTPALIEQANGNKLTASSFDSTSILFRSEYSDVLSKFDNTILSMSPRVKFPLPYLLMKIREDKIKISDYSKGGNLVPSDEDYQLDCLEFFVLTSAKKETIDNDETQDTFGWTFEPSIEAQSGLDCLKANEELLSPLRHQNIIVLQSTLCILDGISTQCQEPQIFRYDYYGSFDVPLGSFVEDFCYDANYHCKVCKGLGLNHIKTYIHGTGRIRISIESSTCVSEGMENVILMWSLCKECGFKPPLIPMSEEAWKYSFGKYLELLFYHPDMACRTGECPHPINRYHVRYFGFKNLAVKVDYEDIELYEVTVPPLKLRDHPQIINKIRLEELELTRSKVTRFYDSVSERLKKFPYDNVYPNKLEECQSAIAECEARFSNEQTYYLQELYKQEMDGTKDIFNLNSLKFKLSTSVTQWDYSFNLLAKTFIQTERDMKRFTSTSTKKSTEEPLKQPVIQDITETKGTPKDSPFSVVTKEEEHLAMSDLTTLPKLSSSPTHSHTAPSTTTNDDIIPSSPGEFFDMGKSHVSPGSEGARQLPTQQKRRLSIQMMRESNTIRNRLMNQHSIASNPIIDIQDQMLPSQSPQHPMFQEAHLLLGNRNYSQSSVNLNIIEKEDKRDTLHSQVARTDSFNSSPHNPDELPSSPQVMSRQTSFHDFGDISFSPDTLFESPKQEVSFDEDDLYFTDDSDREAYPMTVSLTRMDVMDECLGHEDFLVEAGPYTVSDGSRTPQTPTRLNPAVYADVDLSKSIEKPKLSEFIEDTPDKSRIQEEAHLGHGTNPPETAKVSGTDSDNLSVVQYLYNKIPKLTLSDGPSEGPKGTPNQESMTLDI
jgi:1-phosphatidylinositol-3-phosphate 5-kinase